VSLGGLVFLPNLRALLNGILKIDLFGASIGEAEPEVNLLQMDIILSKM